MRAKEFARHIFEQVKSNWCIPVTEWQRAQIGQAIKIGVYTDESGVEHDWYRKIVTVTPNNSPYTVNNIVPSGAVVTDVRFIVKINSSYRPVYYNENTNYYWGMVNGTSLSITIGGTGIPNNPITATIEYYLPEVSTPKVPYEPLHEWSTEEKLVGYWIDGKAVYEKTVDCGALPNKTTKQINHGITSIDKIIKVEGIAIRDTGVSLPVTFAGSESINNNIQLNADKSKIYIVSGVDRSIYTGYITLRYTKTTD